MNALPDRPAMPPLPPPDGAFGRVQRRAFLRKMRVPAAGAVGAAIVVGALTVAPVPQASDRLQVTTEPSESPTPEPTRPEPTPFASASGSPAPPTPTPTPTPDGPTPVGTGRPATPTPAPTTPDPGPAGSPKPAAYTDETICDKGAPGRYGPDITGVVVDRRGNPVRGVTITSAGCENGSVHPQSPVSVTDAEGRFSFACLDAWAVAAPYLWYIEWAKPTTTAPVGFALFRPDQYDAVPCGSTHRIVLPDAGTVRVTYVDDEGRPLADRSLYAHIGTEADKAVPISFRAQPADENGTVTLTGIAPGRFWVVAGGGKFHWVTLREGETVDLRVTRDGRLAPAPSASATPAPSETPTATP